MTKKFTSIWEYDLLWDKSRVYAKKSLKEPRESPEFALISTLTLEFLARATLAKIHPVLLADPRDGENLLYVFGYSKAAAPPRSIVAKTVFDRCTKVVPNFTKSELDNCLRLVERRNEELHTGSAAFVDFPTKSWLTSYYKSCKVLLEFNGLTLTDLFGQSNADAAEEMITEVDKALLVEVNKRIYDLQKNFESLDKSTRDLKIQTGSEKANESLKSNMKIEMCICCGAEGQLSGKIVSVSEDKLVDGEIVFENIILPTQFVCFSCSLRLNGHKEVAIAGYGGQFAEKEYWDPAEYHGIETYEPDYSDYGND